MDRKIFDLYEFKIMRFFSLDCHIGIKDLQVIFSQLGHSLDIWSISDHHFIMNWPRQKVDIVNQYTWMNLNQNMCDAFYERYKNELKDYDGFICFYPPAFSLLYEKFHKPIIIQIPLRYETPFFNDITRWKWLNSYLQGKIDNKTIISVTNNKYDQQYFQKFVKRECQLIPSLCDYTNSSYTGKNNKFLYCSKFESFKDWLPECDIVTKSVMKGYSWQDVADFKAIIHMPYSNTLMSVFEQYSMNIPLLFPSKEFLIQLWQRYSKQGVMSELSFRQIFNLTPKSLIDCEGLDPNNYINQNSFVEWSGLSDFYDPEWMPYIELYDSVSELLYKLNSLDFSEISDKMRVFNVERKEKILNKWEKVINGIIDGLDG